MIRYVKYQNNHENSSAYGKWYLRAVADETIDVEGLAAHMAKHNTTFSKGNILGILTDAVSCIKELMLEGKSVKLQDLAIFKIGLVSNGAATAEEAKTTLVTGFRFNAKATGEMSISSLKQEIQLKELKYYTGGETIDYNDENDGGDDNGGDGDDNQGQGDGGDDNQDQGGEQVTTYNLTFRHNDEVMEVRQYAEGATVSAPEPPSGYVWSDLPTTMPARDLVVTTVAEGGDSGEI